jgi:hypothetical protein
MPAGTEIGPRRAPAPLRPATVAGHGGTDDATDPNPTGATVELALS